MLLCNLKFVICDRINTCCAKYIFSLLSQLTKDENNVIVISSRGGGLDEYSDFSKGV